MTIQKRVQDLFNRFNVDLKVTSERIDMAEATLENGTVIYTDADSFLEGAEAYIINDEGEQIALPEGDYELADGDILQIVEGGKVGSIKKAEGKGDGEGEGKGAAKGPRKGVNPKAVTKPVDDGGSGGDGEAGKGGGGKGSGEKKKKGLSADENTTDMDDTKQEYVESYVTREIVEEMIREAVASMMGDKKEEDMEEVVEEVKEEMSVNPEAPKGHSEAEAPAEEPAIEVEIEVELEEEPAKEELSKAQSEIEFLKTQLAEIKKQAATKGVQRMAPTKRTEPVDLTNLTTQERVRALANQFSK
jgi:hypothetical protein